MKEFAKIREAEEAGYTVWDELKCASAYLYRKRTIFGYKYALVPYPID